MNAFGIPKTIALALVNKLTKRERDVAELIAMGETRQEIAAQLGMAPKTVDCHIYKVRDKWGVHHVHCFGRIWFAAMVETDG